MLMVATIAATAGIILYQVNLVGASVTTTNTLGDGVYRHANLFASSTNSAITATSTLGTAYSNGLTAFFDSSGVRFDGTMDIRGAQRAEVYFTRGGAFGAATTGTTTFSIEVTPDGSTWYAFNRLVAATSSAGSTIANTSVQPTVTIGDTNGATVDATTTERYSLDLTNEVYMAARCKVVNTLNGSASCDMTARYGL